MASSKESKVLAKKYQKKTDREHILDAPDTYIGSVEKDEDIGWMLDENNSMHRKKYTWVPGMFKCFDEGMVNCRDHFVRLNEKIKNKEKNILGMMPHPERMIDKYLSGEDGSIFFKNLINNIK